MRLDQVHSTVQDLLNGYIARTVRVSHVHLVHKRVEEAGYSLNISTAAKDFLCTRGYDPAFGARPLKRIIRRYLEDIIAGHIVSGMKSGTVIRVDVSDDGSSLTVNKHRSTRIGEAVTGKKHSSHTSEKPQTVK